jgi:DNA polymerase I-like protein with 3'-5' exonuclease and polymerase domains
VHTEPAPAPATPGTAQASIALSIFKRIARKFIIPATAAKCAGFRGAFDIEGNGLHNATKLHCVVIADLDSNQIYQYGPNQIPAAIEHLSRAAYLTGHNICGYDLPTLRRLHNWSPSSGCTIVDTMVAARLILPNIDDIDDKVAAMTKTKAGKLRGRYSLEAFGARLGIAKVGIDITDFSKWTPELQARCVCDTMIAKALWQFLQPDGYPAVALALEHSVAGICGRITADGAPFAVKAAELLRRQWIKRRTELGTQLSQQFPGTNLNSRKQLGALLEARGWVPEERTEKTRQPKITDEVLETIPAMFPEFTGLAEYGILRRRLAQLSDGKEAWCKHVAADGRIHGGLIHIGTPHSRAKHLAPNLAQVPNPKRGKPFATECRSLFRTDDDRVFVCCDQSGLQDRCFANDLAGFDGGAYAKAFLNGLDPHWKTAADLDLIAKDTTLDKQNRVHAAIRENSKSFRYAFLFGAGQIRAGHIINNAIRAVQAIDADSDLRRRFFGNGAHPNEAALKRVGKQALDKFIAGTPGLRRLRAQLSAQVERFGWLSGLDGRRVPCGAQYTALNYQVTSAEAVITKRWLVRVFDELNQKFRYGWDGDCVIALWIHDEIAVCCRPEIADEIGAIMVKHAKEPGEFYGFKVPLDAEYKIGRSWAGEPINSCDTILPGHSGNNPSEITHQRPSYEVESETNHYALVENPPNSENFSDPKHASADDENHADTTAANGSDGDGASSNGGGNASTKNDYRHAQQDPDKPYGPVRAALLAKGYRLARTFPFVVPAEIEPRFYEDRYELLARIAPRKERPRKTCRYWHRSNGQILCDTGPRRIIYNWPAIMAAGPGATVFITEGANKSAPLNEAQLLATAAPYHQWSAECAAALAGDHLIYLEDHDHNDANGNNKAREFSAVARKKLSRIAASFRIVPAKHLWRQQGHDGEPPHGWDVKNWIDLGGEPAKLREICREIPADGSISAEPYEFPAEADIQSWQWLYARHLLRGEVAGTAAMGGTGKSSKSIVEALAITSGSDLLGEFVPGLLRVVLINLEDTRNTIDKRIAAAMRHYGLTPADIGDRLIIKAKGEIKIKVARQLRSGDVERDEQIIHALTNLMIEHKADVLSVDSFIRTHKVHENDNSAIEEVVECFEAIAHDAKCAVHLWHHTRKAGGEKATIESARGAMAFIDGVRSARILETMSAKEHAELKTVQPEMLAPGYYFRSFNGKRNFAPPADQSDWFTLGSVVLSNGDDVGVVMPWAYPASTTELAPEVAARILDDIENGMPDGQRYSNHNAAKRRAVWALVRTHCSGKTESQCRRIIATWISNGMVYEDEYHDPVYDRRQVGLFVRRAKQESS